VNRRRDAQGLREFSNSALCNDGPLQRWRPMSGNFTAGANGRELSS